LDFEEKNIGIFFVVANLNALNLFTIFILNMKSNLFCLIIKFDYQKTYGNM